MSSDTKSASKSRRWTPWIIATVLVVAVGGYGWYADWLGTKSASLEASLITYEVEPRDLPITVIERGNLASQTNLRVLCNVDDVRSDGISGTPIIWIIENGASVSKGDLICELDSTGIQAELDEQILDTEEARSAFIQAEANLENQSIQNSTAEDKAKLTLELAELSLEMFTDEKMGSHQLAREEIQRQIDDMNNDILAAEMSLKLRLNEKKGIESLFKLGYAGKSEMDRSILSFLQAEGDYASKINRLETQRASLDKLNTFEKKMQLLELEGGVRTAEQSLLQVQITNRAKLAQMKGILSSRTEQLAKEQERLKRYQDQLKECKIYAPQDGMVTYVTSSRDPELGEGVPVRRRQHIISIPNLRRMQVETSIHESVLDRVQKGLRVKVRVDAVPDRVFMGTVESVAVLPEQSYYSDTKAYETVITLDEEVYSLKPGMTAVCEIEIDNLVEVNAIPLQAVVQRDGENWVYIKNGGSISRRRVDVGMSNDQFVSINDGLAPGDTVVLNPNSVVGDTEEESVPSDETGDGTTLVASRTE